MDVFRRRQVLIVSLLFLFVAALVSSGLWYQKCSCQPYQDANGDYHPVVGNLICDTITKPEAVFALALVICTILSFGFISTQIAQANVSIDIAKDALEESRKANTAANRAAQAAEEAAQETKRSVDAYMSSERGSMRFYKGELSNLGIRLNFAFKNIGNGTIIVNYFSFHVDYVVGELVGFAPLLAGYSFSVAVPPGNLFTTYRVDGAEPDALFTQFTGTTFLPKIPPGDEGSLVAQFRVIYDDQFGQFFEYRCAAIFTSSGARVLSDPEYTYERNVTREWKAISKGK